MARLDARRIGLWLLLVFVLSGFSGLIYQSIWSHYLGLVLGHAAYAQTLVLGVFMGGMAAGAWLASRVSTRWGHLLIAYAVLEVIIGVAGLIFHPLFESYSAFSQRSVLASIDSAGAASAWQWLSASALIFPQCVLLGATFPLMSAAYLRIDPRNAANVLGGLYFTNSLGAALGALGATFVLLPAVGMPGAMIVAGALNIVVGLIAWGIWTVAPAAEQAQARVEAAKVETAAQADPGSIRRLGRILLASSFLTGATSFIYEIGWVRMLNQALGTTLHAFELMLAAFILGLAFGGLWIKRRSDRINDAIHYAGHAQIWMGVAALLSVVVLGQSFVWVGWMMGAFSPTGSGYTLYSLGGAVVSLLVMFPAAFFAGMTLPLFTTALLKAGAGERAIGRVYASNTLGAIVGVAAMVHVLIPVFGIRLSLVLAAVADAFIGFYLIRVVSPARVTRGLGVGVGAVVACALLAVFAGRIDPNVQVSGVFRHGEARISDNQKVHYLRDGKTATVAFIADTPPRYGSIITNGKPDASLALTMDLPPTADEVTMRMAAALPLALLPAAESYAIIGWGSGMTTDTLARSSKPKTIETIEIEPAMVDGAKLFGDRVAHAYSDPRSTIHIDDARTYFSTGGRHFDVIISEPSNPWVSGVASLFTTQFYEFILRHLKEGGLLIQWVQSYELNDPLLATMIAALLEVFPDVDVYVTNTSDLLFVAGTAVPDAFDWSGVDNTDLAEELRRVGLAGPADLALRKLGGRQVLETFVKLYGAGAHSDYYPVVSLQAPRARFTKNSSDSLQQLSTNGMPVVDMLDGDSRLGRSDAVAAADASFLVDAHTLALALQESMLGGRSTAALRQKNFRDAISVDSLLRLSERRVDDSEVKYWSKMVSDAASWSLGMLPPRDLQGMWINPSWIDASQQPAAVQDALAAYAAAANRDAAAMRLTAAAALERHAAHLAPEMNEQLLVIGQLGAASEKDFTGIRTFDEKHGRGIPLTPRLGFVRKYLLAWADR